MQHEPPESGDLSALRSERQGIVKTQVSEFENQRKT